MEEPVARPSATSEAATSEADGARTRPDTAEGASSRRGTRYEDDLYSWVREQVEHLRAGRVDALDLANIAEELDDVGIAQYHRLESALRVLLMHMLKWDQQPEKRSRSWVCSIAEQRSRISRLLHKNPGLKSRIEEACDEAYESAVRWAAQETGLVESDFPQEQPYAWNDILNRPFDLDADR